MTYTYTYTDFMADLKAAIEETEEAQCYEMAEEPHADDFVDEEFNEIWEGR